MKRMIILTILVLSGTSVSSQSKKNENAYLPFREMITSEELRALLHFVASDFFAGRKSGSEMERGVALYLASYYGSLGIPGFPAKKGETPEAYLQPFSYSSGGNTYHSQNVVAFIEGMDKIRKEEYVIIIAHYDHLGSDTTLTGDSIYNGAADDASGTVALMEIAESLIEAKRKGSGPGRSILILHAGAEEHGLHGSTFFIDNPLVPLDRVAAVINMDGVGGTDKPGQPNAHNYIYLLSNDSTASPVSDLVKARNKTSGIQLEILQPSNPERFNSDNKPFEYELIPAVYFSTGLTEHYHKVSDAANTIEYEHLEKVVQLVFETVVAFSNEPLGKAAVTRADWEKTGQFYCPPCGCKSDGKSFTSRVVCPDCGMFVQPSWKLSR